MAGFPKAIGNGWGLAQALLNAPPVLILDEPTVGLDPRQIIEIRDIIKGLRREHTVILSTHILPEVSMTCDRVVIISGGQVTAVDTPDNLTERAQRHRLIHLEVHGPKEAVMAHLQRLDGVLSIEAQGTNPQGVSGYTLATTKARDVRADIAQSRRATRLAALGVTTAPSEPRRSVCAARDRGERRQMRSVYAVFKREIKAYFTQPIAYVMMGGLLLIVGFLTTCRFAGFSG